MVVWRGDGEGLKLFFSFPTHSNSKCALSPRTRYVCILLSALIRLFLVSWYTSTNWCLFNIVALIFVFNVISTCWCWLTNVAGLHSSKILTAIWASSHVSKCVNIVIVKLTTSIFVTRIYYNKGVSRISLGFPGCRHTLTNLYNIIMRLGVFF